MEQFAQSFPWQHFRPKFKKRLPLKITAKNNETASRAKKCTRQCLSLSQGFFRLQLFARDVWKFLTQKHRGMLIFFFGVKDLLSYQISNVTQDAALKSTENIHHRTEANSPFKISYFFMNFE